MLLEGIIKKAAHTPILSGIEEMHQQSHIVLHGNRKKPPPLPRVAPGPSF